MVEPARRSARITRRTSETEVDVALDLDGGPCALDTGIGFFDHMLDQVSRHAGFALVATARGDRQVDDHHTVEDVGIALGEALREALGSKRGIARYADCLMPMDEALTRVALDISGRPFLVFRTTFAGERIGSFDTQLVREFFTALAMNARLTLHIETLYGDNDHHVAESCFKGVARVLGAATRVVSPGGAVPSTKGTL